MFSFFKCSHPASHLAVEKEHTVKSFNEDFEYVEYHFFCMKCDKPITIGYAKLIGGVDAFIERGRKKDV